MLTGHEHHSVTQRGIFQKSKCTRADTCVLARARTRAVHTESELAPDAPRGPTQVPTQVPSAHSAIVPPSPPVPGRRAGGLGEGTGRPSGTLLAGAGRGRAALSFARAAALRGG